MSKAIKIGIGAVVGLVVVVSAGTFVYLNFIQDDAPPPLSLSSSPSTTTAGSPASTAASSTDTSIAGAWRPTTQSIFGYRVNEVLFGQSKEAAGRTNKVTGTLVVDGDTVSTTELSVDMASVSSDSNRRDSEFRGRIMAVTKYPTATFKLTQPIQISDPAAGTVSAKATGDLTLHGTTKSVTFDIKPSATARSSRSTERFPSPLRSGTSRIRPTRSQAPTTTACSNSWSSSRRRHENFRDFAKSSAYSS